MTGSTPGLSVVIPAYDEVERIGDSLARILSYLDQRAGESEVIVVDDGSRDGSGRAVAGFGDRGVQLLTLDRNRGKGAAVRAGVLASRGDWVLISDADLSTPIEELERLEEASGEAEIVFASRALPSSEILIRQALYRQLLGKTFNLLVRLLRLSDLRDTQCGFKLIRGDLARGLFRDLRTPGFAFDVELVLLGRRRGHRTVEIGVRWADSGASKVRPLRHSLAMLRELLWIRWRSLFGDLSRRD